ncbi:hypothetical protein [Candidatus Villigracilis saccharophilus]|uniref:hypothetical protein n=1 Tax=Candidatus Villigracilis saccharophilus TaxID=3140684 RepID=UPI0031373D56|nr:hypothetical protein [Anaerolineales bacterium]
MCTNQQNNWNKDKPANNKSGYTGVYWSQQKQRWFAKIKENGKIRYIGSFRDIQDAATAREREAKRVFGEYYRKPAAFPGFFLFSVWGLCSSKFPQKNSPHFACLINIISSFKKVQEEKLLASTKQERIKNDL